MPSLDIAQVTLTIQEFLAEFLKVPVTRITPESRFIDYGIDSLQVVDFVLELEGRFDVSIEDHEVAQLKSVDDLAKHVYGLLRGRSERVP